MIRTIAAHTMKKTAAVVISGTLVVATGGLALAAAGDGDTTPETVDDTTTTTEDTAVDTEDTTTTTESTTTTEAPTTTVVEEEPEELEEPQPLATTEPADTEVVDGDYANHGEAVSEAARTCPPGPEHGPCVAAVAQSGVGKQSPDEHHDEELDDDADEGAGPPAGVGGPPAGKGRGGR